SCDGRRPKIKTRSLFQGPTVPVSKDGVAAEVEGTMVVAQGPEGDLFPYLCDLVRSALPSIIASGAATAAEIEIDTLEQRLVADAPTSGVVGTVSAGYVGVWARKP